MNIWPLVIQDMEDRDEVGARAYKQHLSDTTQIDPLREAYFEALDLAVYLRRALYDRDRL